MLPWVRLHHLGLVQDPAQTSGLGCPGCQAGNYLAGSLIPARVALFDRRGLPYGPKCITSFLAAIPSVQLSFVVFTSTIISSAICCATDGLCSEYVVPS